MPWKTGPVYDRVQGAMQGTHVALLSMVPPTHTWMTQPCVGSDCIGREPLLPLQVEVFVMSKSGFAFSAAYSTVPVRGVWMQRDVDACTWSNYNDHCLMRACPGQVCNGTLV